jgi:DNA modification methylase
MNTFQILTSKFRFDLMHWNVSIGPDKRPIFGRFLTLFPLKRPARCEKNTSNMAATIVDVMDDVTCKSSIGSAWGEMISEQLV